MFPWFRVRCRDDAGTAAKSLSLLPDTVWAIANFSAMYICAYIMKKSYHITYVGRRVRTIFVQFYQEHVNF